MTGERWERGRRRRGGSEDDGGEGVARTGAERRGRKKARGEGGGEDDTLSVILGLVPRICRACPASGAHVARAADPRLKGEDDGGEVGARTTPSPSSSGLSRGSAGPAPRAVPVSPAPQILASRARMTGGEVGARMTPSPSSSGLSRGSAGPAPRAVPVSPAPQILASRARMTGGEVGARMTGERARTTEGDAAGRAMAARRGCQRRRRPVSGSNSSARSGSKPVCSCSPSRALRFFSSITKGCSHSDRA